MSNSTPDFSGAFEVAERKLDDLEEAEQKLRARREKREAEVGKKHDRKPDSDLGEENPAPERPSTQRRNSKKSSSLAIQLVAKEQRCNLTLKVLAENEARFNELFFRLQLKGDGRKKQDLADEALRLLFTKYSSMLKS